MKTLQDLKNSLIYRLDIYQQVIFGASDERHRDYNWVLWFECIKAVEAINKALTLECDNDRS